MQMLFKDLTLRADGLHQIYSAFGVFRTLEMFFYFSLSQSTVIRIPCCACWKCRFLGSTPDVSGQNHYRWRPLNFTMIPLLPCDSALRCDALSPLPVCTQNSSPLLTKMRQAGKGHQTPTGERGRSKFPEVRLLHCIILGQGSRSQVAFQNTLRN